MVKERKLHFLIFLRIKSKCFRTYQIENKSKVAWIESSNTTLICSVYAFGV